MSHSKVRQSAEVSRRIRLVSCIENMLIGGTELNAVRTVERLDRSRFDVSVICKNEQGPLRKRYHDANVPVQVFPIRSLYGVHTIREGLRLGMYLRRQRIEIVHAHDLYSNIFCAVWARIFRIPVVIASRRWWDHVPRRGHAYANRFAYRFAHRVLANSDAVAALLHQSEHVPADRILVIPNFVDDVLFEPTAPDLRQRMRAEFGFGDDDLVVGSVSRLHPVKDLPTLLRAVHTLVPRWPALKLLFVGDGDMRQALEAETATLGLSDRVRFAGMRPQVPNMHAALDISVCCSLSEGFPNSVVEAMAAGRSVVATNVGGIPDAVDHGRTGLLVPVSDPKSLAAAIETLLADPAQRERLGTAGREVARARFSASGVISKLEGTYERLVSEALGVPVRASPAPIGSPQQS